MPRSKDFELIVDPQPRFDLSPYMFMQFMEPLGLSDGSVEAGWNFLEDSWQESLINITKELAPPMIRWPGGCFSSYYRWKEGVGPRDKRKPMHNLCWGGMETNQVGTHEYIAFCNQVSADPLIAVNFESDGRQNWAHPPKGGVRSAGPEEAAEWIDYCNNPSNAERIKNGSEKPFDVRIWQIGNETSYARHGYDCETTAKRTVAFAQAMRKADPDIELIGWGDSGWAGRMLEVAGEELQYLAFHHHFRSNLDEESPLSEPEYRKDPEQTWRHLMSAYKSSEVKFQQMREQIAGSNVKLVLTESHFGLPGRHRCEVLSSWAAGVANARVLNTQARNGDIIKIATLADFAGTTWMNNAIIIHRNLAYMMPVARVMSLYRHHNGKKAIHVTTAPEGLDVTASRTGSKIFLHVVNTNRTQAVFTDLQVEGLKIVSGRVFEIADDPVVEIDQSKPDLFAPIEYILPDKAIWQFPAASVSAVELDVEEDKASRPAPVE